MKKLLTLMLIFCIYANLSAQVTSDTISKLTLTDYTPFNPRHGNVEGIFPLNTIDTVKVYYWIIKKENGVTVNAKRKTDCFIPWNKNDTYKDTFILFNAWIEEKYNLNN